ncbi:hypothetical protein BWI97_04905 [Siphonobacter sp. BAB-5405]|uniref:hypothetical protein n=1 Tax=Siphonobacter sp. BAB-5405 TaxID=1864825 RepID=UPI000C805EC5|nr:hypothetical protein [Siphonobacter sp. BAB-5405]PMD98498.1 hypothetical protein BWI97_04905 [Siphonobacter sp. BAB-5405]
MALLLTSVRRKSIVQIVLILGISLGFLTGCTVRLAPQHNQALVAGLVEQNKAVMEFFAFYAWGTKAASFPERLPEYNRLIGNFDALALQADARPVPRNKIKTKVNEALQKRGIPVLEEGEIPSATALRKIYETLVKMRNTDQKQGLTLTESQAFKGQVKIYLDQALTYENFLER